MFFNAHSTAMYRHTEHERYLTKTHCAKRPALVRITLKSLQICSILVTLQNSTLPPSELERYLTEVHYDIASTAGYNCR